MSQYGNGQHDNGQYGSGHYSSEQYGSEQYGNTNDAVRQNNNNCNFWKCFRWFVIPLAIAVAIGGVIALILWLTNVKTSTGPIELNLEWMDSAGFDEDTLALEFPDEDSLEFELEYGWELDEMARNYLEDRDAENPGMTEKEHILGIWNKLSDIYPDEFPSKDYLGDTEVKRIKGYISEVPEQFPNTTIDEWNDFVGLGGPGRWFYVSEKPDEIHWVPGYDLDEEDAIVDVEGDDVIKKYDECPGCYPDGDSATILQNRLAELEK